MSSREDKEKKVLRDPPLEGGKKHLGKMSHGLPVAWRGKKECGWTRGKRTCAPDRRRGNTKKQSPSHLASRGWRSTDKEG